MCVKVAVCGGEGAYTFYFLVQLSGGAKKYMVRLGEEGRS